MKQLKRKIKYFAREGAGFNDSKAQVYGEELARITDINNGELTPKAVLEAAAEEDSVLNELFEWDNSKAAYKYRINQARDLISHITQVVVIEGKQSKQRSFFSVRTEKAEKAYVTVETAVKSNDYRIQLLSRVIVMLENVTQLMKLFKQEESKE
jgi:hypothetical protein